MVLLYVVSYAHKILEFYRREQIFFTPLSLCSKAKEREWRTNAKNLNPMLHLPSIAGKITKGMK